MHLVEESGGDSRSSDEEASDRAKWQTERGEGRPQAGAKPSAPRRGPAASPHRRLTAEPALGVGATPGGPRPEREEVFGTWQRAPRSSHAEGSQRAPNLGRLSGLSS